MIVPKGRGFKMACLNINSLTKHIDELRIVLSNQCVDILAINETKLDGSICDNEVTVVGYNIIRRDRLANGRSGGGICFYIRSNINYFLREDLVMDRLEMLSIEVRKLSTKPFVITTWYRPLNSPVDLFSHLDILLRKLDTENIEHYLMGDINCDLLSENNANVNALLNVSDVYGLKQLITEPTRITPSSSSLIDLIFTNQPDLISFSGVSHVGIRDHSLIYAFGKFLFLQLLRELNW